MTPTERYTDWVVIGKGAFGAVYRVHDRMLQRPVAIKLLLGEHAGKANLVEDLRREVIISRDLRHPNICPIHDVYDGPQGVGTVMDLVEGIELRKWLDNHRGALLDTAAERLAIFRGICEALAFAHTRIVHRDLKPANVFLLQGDPRRPMIMDFGASVVGHISQDGMIAGTAKYMSPEQWESPEKVDRRSDLFALGVMAYEFFTELIPPTSLRYVQKTKTPPRVPLEQIPPPSSFCAAVPPGLDQIIRQMMAYRQEDRPQSAQEVLAVLEEIHLATAELDGKGQLDGETLRRRTVLLAGGEFILGAGPGTDNPLERPNRRVNLTPFRMGIYPVTNAEYRQFIRSTGYTSPPVDDPLFLEDDYPVVGVSYDDALHFAKWVGGTLPTEAQWEYACKGGAGFPPPLFPWGTDQISPTQANINGNSVATSRVGSFPAGRNAFGLYDMCGNTWEWCLDGWAPDYYRRIGADPMVTDPVQGAPSGERVLRGGAFDSMNTQGRCSFRYHAPPGTRSLNIGFRVVFPA